MPSPDAIYIQVDLDKAEIGHSITTRVGVIGDVRTVVSQFLALLPPAAEDWTDDSRVREAVGGVASIDASARRGKHVGA